MRVQIISLHSLYAKLSICPEPLHLKGMPRHWGGHQTTLTAFSNLAAWLVVILSCSRVGLLEYGTLWVYSSFAIRVFVRVHVCTMARNSGEAGGCYCTVASSHPLLDTPLLHLPIYLKPSAALKPLVSFLQGHSTMFLNRNEGNLEKLPPFTYFGLLCPLVCPWLFSLLSSTFKQNF